MSKSIFAAMSLWTSRYSSIHSHCPSSSRKSFGCGMSKVLLLSALSFVSACSDDSENQPASGFRNVGARSVPVVALPASVEALNETVQAVGTARALKSVTLYPETAGIVTAVNFNADDAVTAGNVLLELDARDERLAVELAQVQLADAERVVRRYTTVNKQNANIAESQIDEARAAVDAAKIALEQARVALDRRQIKAPFDGRVGITDIDIGDRIDTSTIVTTLDDRSQLLVNFAVPEAYVGQVRPGTEVDVHLWNSNGATFSGEVVAVDSRIDATSRAFTARAAIDNSTDRFRPGMAFEIGVNVSRGRYLSVPDVSVQWGADGPYIWIEQKGKATRRDVRLVKRLPNRLLLESDISVGTPVIAEGVQAVREGVELKLFNGEQLDRDARAELAQPTPDIVTPGEKAENSTEGSNGD